MESLQTRTSRMTSPEESNCLEDHWILKLFGNRRPLAFDAGDSNLYRYAGNTPTNATDPSGLETPSCSNPDRYLRPGPRPVSRQLGGGYEAWVIIDGDRY